MSVKAPKQSPNKNNSLPALLQYHLNRKGIKPSALADKCGIARSTISRLLKGIGNNGNKYNPSLDTLEAMSRVLRLTERETDDLFLAAYPKFRVWRIANQRNLDFDNTEDLLDEHGCPTLSRVQPYEGD